MGLLAKIREARTRIRTLSVVKPDRRSTIERAWTALASPRQLSTDPEVWLLTTPTSLSMGELVVHPDHLELLVGYTGTVQTVLGPPGPTPEPPPPQLETRAAASATAETKFFTGLLPRSDYSRACTALRKC